MMKHFAYCTVSTMCSTYACLTFNGELEASFLKVNATFTKAKLFQVLSIFFHEPKFVLSTFKTNITNVVF